MDHKLPGNITTTLVTHFQALVDVLKQLGYDTPEDSVNTEGTAERAARAFAELVLPLPHIYDELASMSKNASFPMERDETHLENLAINSEAVVSGILFSSICPHHLLPVLYSAEVKIREHPETGPIGLSKYQRAISLLARRPVLQERLIHDIAKLLTGDLRLIKDQPKIGFNCKLVHVSASAIHMCCAARGINNHSYRFFTEVTMRRSSR